MDFWGWSGSFFSDQSRRTVMAERAPGRPAVTGEMAATAPRRKSSTPVLALLTQVKRGVALRACVAAARRLEVFSLVPIR